MTILVSACLLGCPCRYDGKSKPNEQVLQMAEKHQMIPVCPEQLGGLPTPRPPAEWHWQSQRYIREDGTDVSEYFLRGAEEAVRISKLCHAECAILKERSPSCGLCWIYDGTFTKNQIPSMGATAYALYKSGLQIYGEYTIPLELL